jgi:pyruvate formate lyase activating enzyme
MTKAMIFNIQRFSTEDGPGIRTTVFFKGCPLRCSWCSNPESQKEFRELSHRSRVCNQCGKCVEICEPGAISLASKKIKIKRNICTNCGKCVEVCSLGALNMMGKSMTVEEVLREVLRDSDYYAQSGGGVTASGGEPLMQGEFVASFFKRCQQAGVHTALDTSGYASSRILHKVLRYTNLVLFDIKLMDAGLSRRFTGVSNKLILHNAREIDASGIPQIIRVPLIPSINCFEQNIRDIAHFVKSLKQKTPVELLPYHRLGLSKYESLDRRYRLRNEDVPSEEYVHRIQDIFLALGVECKISH